jgi:phage terminase large subunit
LFFNEGLEMDKAPVDGLIMRCRKFVVIDFNPRLTNHWIFDMKGQPEVYFTHSTYRQNRFLTQPIIQGIEKTSPWLIEDCVTDEEGKALIPEDKRRSHEKNVREKTVDKWRWEVYGMGRRANKEGLIYPNVIWIDEFPDDIEDITYGMDFGTTAQTAIVKAGIRIMETGKHKLYLKKLFYLPTEDSDLIGKILYELEINRSIYCDNNKPGWIVDLRRMKKLQEKGCVPLVTKKFDGSREYWIDSIKKFDIHIVKDTDFQTEQENFKHLVKDGIQLSEAEKKWDHLWSASGYAVVGKWRTIVGDPKQKV